MSIIDSCCHDCESCVNDKRTVLNHVGLILEDILTKTLCIYDAVGLYIHNNVTTVPTPASPLGRDAARSSQILQ